MSQDKTAKAPKISKEEAVKKAYNYETKYHGCSQCTFLALQEFLGMENELAFRSAAYLCGGMAYTGNTCGALTAGAMALGMKYGRANIEEGFVGLVNGSMPVYKLAQWFKDEFGSVLCSKISETEITEEELQWTIENPKEAEEGITPELTHQCSEVVSKTVGKVIDIINEVG